MRKEKEYKQFYRCLKQYRKIEKYSTLSMEFGYKIRKLYKEVIKRKIFISNKLKTSRENELLKDLELDYDLLYEKVRYGVGASILGYRLYLLNKGVKNEGK